MSDFTKIAEDIRVLGTSPREVVRDRADIARRIYDAVARGAPTVAIGLTVPACLLADLWASFDVRVVQGGYLVILPQPSLSKL
jgi:phytoene/squalene synthetase